VAPRVLVTRQPDQAGELRDGLHALGVIVVELPLIEIAPPLDPAPLDAALDRIADYDWVVFTSANAVASVAGRLAAAGRPWPAAGPRIACVGPATAAAVGESLAGAPVELQPAHDHRAEGLLGAFAGVALGAARVLLPSSERARDVVPRGLRERGAVVDAPVAYRTLPAEDLGPRLRRALAEGVDVVTFASPSAVESFVAALPPGGPRPPAAVIGPLTAETARAQGFRVVALAQPSTAAGLLGALRAHLGL